MNGIPAPAEVLEQLRRILGDPDFAASNRLAEFLRFVVEEQLAGRGQHIKEYVIGVQVYHKGEGYDPRNDPTVRVDAGKLRARLAKYYEAQGEKDPILITIPKGAYLPDFEFRNGPPEAVSPSPSVVVKRFPLKLVLASILLLAGALGAVGFLLKTSPSDVPATRIVTLTSYLGEQSNPSFSPDGSMIAFSWNGENRDNFDIYIKVVDAPNAVRLTTAPARDAAPAWSPDGRRIAFLRNPAPSGDVYILPALGGSERQVAASSLVSVNWSADSNSLLVSDRPAPGEPYAGFLVAPESGRRKQLSFPPRESLVGDFDFVASPDGATVAFCRMVQAPVVELWLTPVAEGKPRKITQSNRFLAGLAWTPDSRGIVYSSKQSGVSALWRVMVNPPAAPVLIAGVETDAVRPAIPRWGANRIAYQRVERSYRMWRASVTGSHMSPPRSILPSQRWDAYPQISPDGQYLAFASDRAGNFDIWVTRLDGSDSRNLTPGSGLSCGSPRWSPDGAAIAFDAHRDGEGSAIFIVKASGGPLHRVTSESSPEVRPNWSQDGRWIYFRSDRTGRQEIWKMPATGGTAVQVTTGGGSEAFESVDGRVLYFLRNRPSGSLWKKTAGSGEEVLVREGVREGRWSVANTGIYFVDAQRRICKVDENGRADFIGSIEREGPDSSGLTVSRDGREIVYVQPEPVHSELKMAEGRLF